MSHEHKNHEHENHEPTELTPLEQTAIERVLAATSPAPPRLDRDRLMFLAGVASVDSDLRPATSDLRLGRSLALPTSRTAWHWPAATAALAATSLALAIALLTRPSRPERIVYVRQPVELASDATAAPSVPAVVGPFATIMSDVLTSNTRNASYASSYLQTRDVALRLGLDALGTLPSGTSSDAPAPTYRSLLESLTPALPRSPGPPTEFPQM